MSGTPSSDLLSHRPVSNPSPSESFCSPFPYWLLSTVNSISRTCLQFHAPPFCHYYQGHLEPYLVSWAAARALLPALPNPRSPSMLAPEFFLQEADSDVSTLLTFLKKWRTMGSGPLCLHFQSSLLAYFKILTIFYNYIDYFQIPLRHHCLCCCSHLWCAVTERGLGPVC